MNKSLYYLSLAALVSAGCQSRGSTTSSPGQAPEPSGVIASEPVDETADNLVEPKAPGDFEISAAVRREVMFDQSIPSTAVAIDTTAGVGELTGTVPHLLAKERATRKAEVVKGVRAVSNRLVVIPTARKDEEIKADIERALLLDPTTESFETDVKVDDQVVDLAGTVDSWAERDMVERLAKSVEGVREVRSQISIEIGERRPDHEIEQDVRSRLKWDALVDDGPLEVGVDDGVVTLTGAVASLAEKRRVRSDAWVLGVSRVEDADVEVDWNLANDMRRDEPSTPAPDEIRRAFTAAAAIDPRIRNPKLIEPNVDGNTVTLTGSVATLRARQAAYELAHNTSGVEVVVNEIDVAPKRVEARKLRDRVEFGLTINPITSADDIEVAATAAGDVTLSGHVDTFAEAAEAVDIAANVEGVETVANHLRVVDPTYGFYYDPYAYPYYPYLDQWMDYSSHDARSADAEIQSAIEREIYWSPWVSIASVDVDVNAGVATLRGTVLGTRGHDAAIENAIEGGAVAIVDELDIRWYD